MNKDLEKRYSYEYLRKTYLSEFNDNIADLIWKEFNWQTFGSPTFTNDDINGYFLKDFKDFIKPFGEKNGS